MMNSEQLKFSHMITEHINSGNATEIVIVSRQQARELVNMYQGIFSCQTDDPMCLGIAPDGKMYFLERISYTNTP